MTKREREENKLPRLTAYATADGYRLKFLQAFLKREHGVGVVRVFDDCLYAVGRHIYAPPVLRSFRCIISHYFPVTAQVRESGHPRLASHQVASLCLKE